MKKTLLFIFSITVALGIDYYTKQQNYSVAIGLVPKWKTFVKQRGRVIAGHATTSNELEEAQIEVTKNNGRSPSSIKDNPFKGFMIRQNRILMGELDMKYEDDNTELNMINKLNPNWKEIMGNDLMRFQSDKTKLLVKEELPVIKIQDGIGRYLEQVVITYLNKDGDRNSFKALVDSDTGVIVETWDRTIQEKLLRNSPRMDFPTTNESGIIAR
jgi:hypothetical protein